MLIFLHENFLFKMGYEQLKQQAVLQLRSKVTGFKFDPTIKQITTKTLLYDSFFSITVYHEKIITVIKIIKHYWYHICYYKQRKLQGKKFFLYTLLQQIRIGTPVLTYEQPPLHARMTKRKECNEPTVRSSINF